MLNYVCGANPEIRTGLFEESETDGMKQDVNDYVIEYTITTSKIGSDFLNVEPLSIEIDPGVTAEVISSLSKKARSAIGCALVYAHMQHKYEFESESTESHPLWQRPTVAKDHFRQQAEQIDRDLYEAIYNGAFGTYNSHPEFYDTDMLDGN